MKMVSPLRMCKKYFWKLGLGSISVEDCSRRGLWRWGWGRNHKGGTGQSMVETSLKGVREGGQMEVLVMMSG